MTAKYTGRFISIIVTATLTKSRAAAAGAKSGDFAERGADARYI